jgi:hypothetical protein
MKIVIYRDEELDSTNIDIGDVENAIDIIRKYGYEDSEGIQYVFVGARVEYSFTVFIYVKVENGK